MTFVELQAAMISAMKERNRAKKEVIADMIACAKNIAIEQGCKDDISEEIVTAAILKSKKVCQEQIDTCPANRPDILEAYKTCMNYINEFAPQMMSEEDVTIFVAQEVIALFKDHPEKLTKGIIMKAVMPKIKGKADGKTINKVVENVLKEGL